MNQRNGPARGHDDAGQGRDPALESLLSSWAEEARSRGSGPTAEFAERMRALFEREAAREAAAKASSARPRVPSPSPALAPPSRARRPPAQALEFAPSDSLRTSRASRALPWLAAAAALAILAAMSWTSSAQSRAFGPSAGFLARSGGEMKAIAPALLLPGGSVETAPSERALVTLDGGRIALAMNEGSSLGLQAPDRVRLERGEAWFRVRPNSGRFTVETPSGLVEVMGTEFHVAVGSFGSRVALARGKVAARSPSGAQTILDKPGQVAGLAPGGANSLLQSLPEGAQVEPDWAREVTEQAQIMAASIYFPSGGMPAPGARNKP